MMRLYSLVLTVLIISTQAFAVQKKEGDPDNPIPVTASLNDPNIISVDGGRITSVWGTDDKVSLEANTDTGQALFTPISKKPFTLFVQTEAGFTYTLTVTPRDNLIGQQIEISEQFTSSAHQYDRDVKITSFKGQVKRLLKKIEQSRGATRLRGFQLKAINEDIALWAEANILHALSWTQGNLVIDKYLITNISDKALIMNEREFRELNKRVRAVSIQHHQLEPAQTTVLYTFRSSRS